MLEDLFDITETIDGDTNYIFFRAYLKRGLGPLKYGDYYMINIDFNSGKLDYYEPITGDLIGNFKVMLVNDVRS